MSGQKDIYLVIGGSGFVGRHIVQLLLDRGDVVSVFDIVQRYHDVPFYSGDISEEEQVASAIQRSGATCIIHTASPPHGHDPALYFKVNVDGTRAVIAAAQANGVTKLVYTSSAGVIFNGQDIIDVDERLSPPEQAMDAYNESKAKAEEMVINSNGQGGLLTVALRPAGIFGPGDRQVMHGLYQVYERGQTHFQIGDNTNLFDWTYVTNVARAHLLAADKLVAPPPPPEKSEDALDVYQPTEEELALINYPLPPIELTTGSHRVPTHAARPLGPYVTPPPDAEKIEAAFTAPGYGLERPVGRSRFDPFSDNALARYKTSPLQVAGQVFFITNGEPVYFWDFMRAIWTLLDDPANPKPVRKPVVFSKTVGLALATGAEWWGWLVGKEPAFTKFRVQFSCATRWHNIEKARRVLGYEPEVGVEEGIRRTVAWWKAEHGKA
ncbi:hypothetical protein PLICRDRAFT_91995 [Plicaturopsis crispa FD-325 SS-3]|nr:hypothetical protein PLICRDRAFT_91995 [Plicaturopsis crispa FD-325 SS-3]